jgi:hypothetical protein
MPFKNVEKKMGSTAAAIGLAFLPDIISALQDKRKQTEKEIDFATDQIWSRPDLDLDQKTLLDKQMRARYWNRLNAQLNDEELSNYLEIDRTDTTAELERKQQANDNLDFVQQMSNDTKQDLTPEDIDELEQLTRDQNEPLVQKEQDLLPEDQAEFQQPKSSENEPLIRRELIDKDVPILSKRQRMEIDQVTPENEENVLSKRFKKEKQTLQEEDQLLQEEDQLLPVKKKKENIYLEKLSDLFGKLTTQLQGQQHKQRQEQQLKNEMDQEYFELVLDSYYCDTSFGPNYDSKNFPVFYLNRKLDDIVAMKILEVNIPNSYYNVNTGLTPSGQISGEPQIFVEEFNELHVLTTSEYVLLDPGYYNENTITVNFDQVFSNSSLPHTYTLTWNQNTRKFIISSSIANNGHYFKMTFYYLDLLGFTTEVIYESIYKSNVSDATLTAPEISNFYPLYYYVNSNALGSLFNIVLPATNNESYKVISKIAALNTVVGQATHWQEPCPDKWFPLNEVNLNGRLDFFISTNNDIFQPIRFNGRGFSIKIGILKNLKKRNNSIHPTTNFSSNQSIVQGRTNESQSENVSKYWLDTSREGYWQENPTGYRDPGEFAFDELEREYIPVEEEEEDLIDQQLLLPPPPHLTQGIKKQRQR